MQREPTVRFCKPCNSSSDWEATCWGECRVCGHQGHKHEWCYLAGKEGSLPATQTYTEAAKTGIKKKKKAGDTVPTRIEMPVEAGSDSDSERDNPVGPAPGLATENARAERINLGTAKDYEQKPKLDLEQYGQR